MVAATDVTDRLEEAIDEKLDEQFDATAQTADPCTCEGDKPAKVAVVSPEKTQAEYEHSHYHLIREKARSVRLLEAEWKELDKMTKAAKKRFEADLAKLTYLSNRDPREQLRMPFGETEPTEAKPEADTATCTDDAWQRTPLADLGLSAKILEAMETAKLTTVGELADWGAKYDLTDIKGIGPAKAEEIEESLNKFWAEHPEYTAPVAAGPEEDAEDDEEVD